MARLHACLLAVKRTWWAICEARPAADPESWDGDNEKAMGTITLRCTAQIRTQVVDKTTAVRSSPSEGRGQRQPTTNTKVTAIMRDVGPRNYGEFNEPLFCNEAVLWAVDENGWALLAGRSV